MILFNYCLPTDALYNANIDRFDGVWKVTGDCLGNSEEYQGGSHSKSIEKSNEGTLGIVLIGWFLFSQ